MLYKQSTSKVNRFRFRLFVPAIIFFFVYFLHKNFNHTHMSYSPSIFYFAIVFLIIALIFGLFFKGKRELEINSSGIRCRATFNKLIPWTDIEKINLTQIGRSPWLQITIKNNSKYLNQYNTFKKWAMKASLKKTGAIFSENMLFYPDVGAILSECLGYLKSVK